MSKRIIRHKQIDINNLRPQSKQGKKLVNSASFVSNSNKSPYQLAKSRSNSNMKSQPQIQKTSVTAIRPSKGLVHKRNTTTTYGLDTSQNPPSIVPANANISFHNSINTSFSKVEDQFSSDALQLEINLTERLKECNKTESPYVMTNDKFNIYQKIFTDVIDRDKNFGSLLVKIKTVYDEQLNEVDQPQPNIDRIIEEIRETKQKIAQEKDDKEFINKKIDKLVKENQKFSETLEDREGRIQDLNGKLHKIKTASAKIPKTQENWEKLTTENRGFTDLLKRFQVELKEYRSREKKLLKVVHKLKDKGYPVDEVYEQDVKRRKKKLPIQSNKPPEPEGFESEIEPIASGPPKQVKKPAAVPNLALEATQVENYDSSSSNYEDESEGPDTDMEYGDKDLDSNVPSKTASAKLPRADTEPPIPPNPQPQQRPSVNLNDSKGSMGIPRLSLGDTQQEARQEYQQEFMAHFDEFSESWRQAIQMEKKF